MVSKLEDLCTEMNEIKSLEISLSTCVQSDRRGRPKTSIKQFSPEPKSLIITEYLNQMKNNEKQKDDDQCDTLVTSEQHKDVPISRKHRTQQNRERNLQKLYHCDYENCTYKCKLSCNLVKHKRVHTGEKPYLCDQCTFRTSFVNSLKTHARIHTDQRPYVCEHCSYKCNSSSNLKKHFRHKHRLKCDPSDNN